MYTGSKNALLRISVDTFEDDKLQEHFFLDFLNFEKMQYNPNIFQADLEPPLGLPCLGMKQDMKQPQVPTSASLRRETVSIYGDDTYIAETESVVIDTEKEVLQRQNSIATSIRDFNHGATYLILRLKGRYTSCLTKPINIIQTLFYNNDMTSSGFTTQDHYVSMDSVSDYLLLSGNFTFSGEYEYRGIPCEVFTHVTNNFEGKRRKASILLYFSKPGFLIIDHNGFSDKKLVKMEIRQEGAPQIFHNVYKLNEFDFDEALTAPFDISPCFDVDSRIEFKLELEEHDRITSAAMTANERRALEHDVRNLIAQLCGLDFVRVNVGTAVERRGTVTLTGKLFARPDSGFHFEHSVGKSFGKDKRATGRVLSLTRHVSNIEFCAEQAVLDSNVTDADYCQAAELCILYRAATSDQERIALVDDDPCSHLTKIRGFEDLIPLSTAWDTLEKKIYEDKRSIKLTVKDKTFKFSSIKRINDPNAKLHRLSPLNSFRKTAHDEVTTQKSQMISRKMNAKECAARCLNNLVFPCEAFSYCKDMSSCELHGSFLRKDTKDEPDIGYTVTTNCETYVRSYLHNFERHSGTVARMASTSSDAELTDINNIENCAQLCMESENFQCESFDFCSPDGLKGNCLMYKHHARDFTLKDGENTELNCSHYSRNYFWDYTKTYGVTGLPALATVRGAGGAETCAYVCSSSADCDTFQYCETDDVCRYLDTSSGKPSPLDMLPNFRCYTFIQKETPDVVNRHNNLAFKKQEASESAGGYSAGAMAGLAIAMLVLGFGICFAGLYAWTFYKKHTTADSWDSTLKMEDPSSEAQF
ncbi:antigen B membrane protein [Elysia marginata]|uniref:Antigen B membrane protein n=1 Tax=Elysia marginata TaxID=1093978 RepID=A0AAV4G6J5_9GAST|nr:antigen B membrane protein [Elysia marginata]